MHNFKRAWTTFFPNVVLGFNDALIGLTGALVGFSFALRHTKLIAVAGLVAGLSASMSMVASAYQQARHEKRQNPVKAASFTGISYFVVTVLLVLPFVFIGNSIAALVIMGVIAILLIAGISFYSALLLKRNYLGQFVEMCLFSLGVAAVTFLVWHVLGRLIGI